MIKETVLAKFRKKKTPKSMDVGSQESMFAAL